MLGKNMIYVFESFYVYVFAMDLIKRTLDYSGRKYLNPFRLVLSILWVSKTNSEYKLYHLCY